jgi:hypothetical protein
MRPWTYQFGIALVVLFAGPLLGAGNPARAAFLVRTPGGAEAEAGMAVGEDSDSESRPSPEKPSARVLVSDSAWWSGFASSGASCGGASAPPTSSVAGLPAAALSSTVNLASVPALRWLYFADVQDLPPSFPSRLFRPPRGV